MKFMIASRRSARLYEELLRWQRQFAGVSPACARGYGGQAEWSRADASDIDG
jgi:hypothetical protein